MPSELCDGSVREYLDKLASNLPAPGGGSGAALAGALGAALGSMVANFTVGKERFSDVEEQVQGSLSLLNELRGELMALVDEDVTAYEAVGAAYRLPRATEEERARRDEAIEEALQAAAGVPQRIVRAATAAVKAAGDLTDIGNPNLISDVGCAVRLAQAAVDCAWLNVVVNLVLIRDADFVAQMQSEMDQLRAEARPLADQVFEKVVAKITQSGVSYH